MRDAGLAVLYATGMIGLCVLMQRAGIAVETWWMRRKLEREPHCALCRNPGEFWPYSRATYCPACALAIREARAIYRDLAPRKR